MNQVKQLIKETKKYLTKYDYDKVMELCDKILQIEPESGFGLRFNAIAHSKKGDYSKGLEYYNRLYELYPDEDTEYSISYINEKVGNYEKALEFYDKNSDDKWIQSKRKRLLTKMKAFPVIIEEYEEKLDKLNNQENTTDIIHTKIVNLEEKAVFQYRNRQYDEALESLKNSLRLYQSIESKLYYHESFKNWYTTLKECLDKNQTPEDFFKDFYKFNKHHDIWFNKLNDKFHQHKDLVVYPDLLLELNPDNNELLKMCANTYKYIKYDYSLDCL